MISSILSLRERKSRLAKALTLPKWIWPTCLSLWILSLIVLPVSPVFAQTASLDVDRNGVAEAQTDGQIILRFLFGLRGSALTNGVVGGGAHRTDPAELANFLEDHRLAMLDADCSGTTSPMTDGNLIVRFLDGLVGTDLTNGVVDTAGCRNTASLVGDFLNGFLPIGDTVTPVVIPPGDIAVPSTSDGGSSATITAIQNFLNAASAIDGVDGILPVTHNLPALLPIGSTVVTFSATDAAGNIGTATATITVEDKSAPKLTITSPTAPSLLNTSPITVTGTINDPTATVTVNGVLATVNTGIFSVQVPLTPGTNTLTATGTDSSNNVGTAKVNVTFLVLPIVTITDPANFALFGASPITVIGTVDDPTATVAINGTPANVASRQWSGGRSGQQKLLCAQRPLSPGHQHPHGHWRG